VGKIGTLGWLHDVRPFQDCLLETGLLFRKDVVEMSQADRLQKNLSCIGQSAVEYSMGSHKVRITSALISERRPFLQRCGNIITDGFLQISTRLSL
jgi:hypothetical protein